MDELTERIDLYLNKQLSAEQEILFEKQMAEDKTFAQKVALQQKAGALLKANAWLDTKDKVAQLNQRNSFARKKVTWLKVAAIFIGFVVFGAFMNNRVSDKNLYSNYSVIYPDRISVLGEGSSSGAQILEYYNREEYEVAAELFKTTRENGSGSDLFVVYEAISLQKVGRALEAIQLIENYDQQGNTMNEVLAWNLITAYLSNGNGDKAHQLLLEYEVAEYTYQKESAKALKQDLESFWRF